ncbi:hypothetical protein C8Q79DRAFT_61653 [Trametes meyenii]|nr:hypothetical protein C8Q79DRAFT_61653 [Trametes meyenii]
MALQGRRGVRGQILVRRQRKQRNDDRRRLAQGRGVQSSNPNGGRLAAQLEAQKSAPPTRVPEPRQQERLVKRRTMNIRLQVFLS